MGDLDHCARPSPEHPKDSQWGSGLDSVVANPCVKMMSYAPWTTLSQSELDESLHCHLGICLCHQGRTNPLMETPGHSVYSGSQLTSFFGHIMLLKLDLTNCSNPRLVNKTIPISIVIDTWSISIENMFDRTLNNFTELRQKQMICEWQNTVRGPVAGREVYACNCVYFQSKLNLISDTDTDRRTSRFYGLTEM